LGKAVEAESVTVKQYALYVESGPRRRKTMVHVLDLLGCIAQGPTTEEALEATPEAIRVYLRFLQRHGAAADPAAPFTTTVAQHVTEGGWVGNGDPPGGFAPDFAPLSAEDLGIYLQRLAWLHSDLLSVLQGIAPEQMLAEPASEGRSIYHMMLHMAESQAVYLRYLVGKVDGLPEALKDVRQGPEALVAALPGLWQLTSARLAALTATERQQEVPHGQVTWTARRALRRTLEHEWEHWLELSRRLARAV
jgi:predicted RNase H-like HicB family nuclease/uncharacterized damage-inducible protein DinB